MKIGIICAMDEECEYFLQNINVSQTKTVGKSIFYCGTTADGKEVVLSRSGIGRSNAASVCALMIALYDVDYVINCGIAGAFSLLCSQAELSLYFCLSLPSHFTNLLHNIVLYFCTV